MADQKPPTSKPPDKSDDKPVSKAKGPAEAAPLGSAAASTDPAVQDLLAARSIAVLNDDRAAIADFDEKLANLGVN